MTGRHHARGPGGAGWTRRRVLTLGLAPAAAFVAAGVTGLELVSHGILPGKAMLDTLHGACSVPGPALEFSPPGPSSSRTFYSAARGRTVGYTIAYPPGRRAGDELPLVIMLHGYGGNHADALVGMSPAQAVALQVGGRPLAPMALVTVDGGNGYWNPHPGDDPMAMVIGELIPLCQRLGLGRPPRRIAMMGISMGGYGALLLAEKYPHLIAAAGAISPAIWTSYAQAQGANAGAYASAAAFAANDAVTHAPALAHVAVRVASSYDDPFYPGVQALARVLPAGAVVDLAKGCHTGAFFAEQQPPSLAFLARHLASLNRRPGSGGASAPCGRGQVAHPEPRHREQRPFVPRPVQSVAAALGERDTRSGH
jgi:enterochelin esterase-like enzyme